MAIEIHTIPVTVFQQNARIVVDSESLKAIVVDPGGGAEDILDKISSLDVEAIFLTHAHLDHGGGVAALMRAYKKKFSKDLKLYSCGAEEELMRQKLSLQASIYGLPVKEYENVPEPDLILKDGDKIQLANAEVLFTPGHAPGHLSLFFKKQDIVIDGQSFTAPFLIAGDTLFQGSIGRTDLPGGDHGTLISSIKNKILTLPDDTIVLPGHGESTTVGAEKKSNPFLK